MTRSVQLADRLPASLVGLRLIGRCLPPALRSLDLGKEGLSQGLIESVLKIRSSLPET